MSFEGRLQTAADHMMRGCVCVEISRRVSRGYTDQHPSFMERCQRLQSIFAICYEAVAVSCGVFIGCYVLFALSHISLPG